MKHIVGFSGGVDSQACALWARRTFPPDDVVLMNSDAGGNEHPMTTEFIENYSRTIHPVLMIQAQVQDMENSARQKIADLGLQPTDPLSFELLGKLKNRFPGMKSRFCTEFLKLRPQRRWISQHRETHFPDGFERYVGIRADESRARGLLGTREYDDFFLCWLNRPILDWTKHQVFAFLAEAGEEINPLYRLGFSRVGCALCINASKEDIRLWASRFPEMIDKIRGWETRVGRTFFPPILPGGHYAGIDEVVEWSKTFRGGRQYSLPILEAEVESGMCMSKWGLCE